MKGNVIGINNAIFSPSGGSVGIGFAIPAETAAPIVEKLISGEAIERGYLGVRIKPVTEDFADALGIPSNHGEFVQAVEPGEPADKAGLKAGDVVLSVNGKDVTPDQTLSFLVANIEPGTRVPLELIRDGKRMDAQRHGRQAPERGRTRRPNVSTPTPSPTTSRRRPVRMASWKKRLGVQVVD